MNLFLLVEPFAPTEIIGGDFRRIKRKEIWGRPAEAGRPHRQSTDQDAIFYVQEFESILSALQSTGENGLSKYLARNPELWLRVG